MKVNRRTFVSTSVSGVAAATTTGLATRSVLGANDRIRVASIGVGGMGRSNLRDFLQMPEVDVIIVESNDPEGPFGAKEAGEGPLLPILPAVATAKYARPITSMATGNVFAGPYPDGIRVGGVDSEAAD